MENLNDNKDINRAWENIKENIKTSAKESLGLYKLQHNPRLDGECLQFLDQRKQDKLQWLWEPNQSNVDNINNVRCKASRHFRNRKDISKLKLMHLRLTVRQKIS